MNRHELQQISLIRAKESKVLLDNGCFCGAYYLLGYAVECALKACISKQIKKYDFPDKNLANKSYTHDLEQLLSTAGLKYFLIEESKINADFERNWAIVKDWTEQVRYESSISDTKAKDFYLACTERKNGILSWLKKYW